MDVCQRNVARFVHVECRFDKIEEIFTGFWKLGDIATSERWVRKIAKGKEIWTNLSHKKTGAPTSRCEELLLFNLNANVQLVKRDT